MGVNRIHLLIKVEEVDLLVTVLTVIMPPPVFFAVSVNLNRHVFTSQETFN